MGERPDLVNVFPLENLGYRVSARNEEKIGVGASGADVAKSVNRIRRAVALDVDAAHRESRVSRRGDDRHEVPVFALGDVSLHPRFSRGNEDDLVEIEILLHFTRGNEVPVVDGVEGSTHDTDALAALGDLTHAVT